jgi:AcrR family transcriptional regulator
VTAGAPGRKYAGRGPQERKDERRGRLIAAGLDLYGVDGYNPTTITDVCRKAGVAPVHFYESFDNKEALLRAVYDGIVDGTRQAVLQALEAQPLDASARAAAGLAAFCEDLMSDPRRARVQCVEVVGVSPEMELHRRSVIRSYASLVLAQLEEIRDRAGVASPPAVSDPALLAVIATAVVGGVNEAMIDWLLADDRPAISTVTSALIELFGAVAVAVGVS